MRPLNIVNNAVRAKEIVSILLRFGFEDLLQRLAVPQRWLDRFVPSESSGMDICERTRRAFESLGPTFIKLGQILSTRQDVLPQALIHEFSKLRNQVSALPFEKMEPILNQELGCNWQEIFADLETTCIAAGSLGQVYRARLKETGEAVAIKLQRPGIVRSVMADFEIIGWFAKKMDQHIEELRPFDIPGVVKEAKEGLIRELDFSNEARNATFFNNSNPFPEKVFAPHVHEQFTTTRLMVAEWVDGFVPGESELPKEELTALAKAGGESLFHQIVINGFFHADPHPGNVLITPDQRLCFIDWGLAGQLTRKMRYFLSDLFVAITSGDPERVVRVGMRMASRNRRVHRQALEKEVSFCIRKYVRFDAESEAIGKLIIELLYIFGSNGIHIVRDYTLLAKAVMGIEETGKCLEPDFDIRVVAKPFLEQLVWERWNPVNVGRDAFYCAQSMFDTLKDLPGDLQRVFRRLEEDDLSVKLKMQGLDSFTDSMNAIANRLVLSVIIGALLIGSSIVITTGLPPLIWGYSAIGVVGYQLSAFLGLWVVIQILRRGRHNHK